jgi:hypothetical protein
MRFFLKCLNPFKNKTKFKFDLFLGFIIQNPEGVCCWAKKESCFTLSPWLPQSVSWILEITKIMFVNFELESLENRLKIQIGWSHRWVVWSLSALLQCHHDALYSHPRQSDTTTGLHLWETKWFILWFICVMSNWLVLVWIWIRRILVEPTHIELFGVEKRVCLSRDV